MSSYAREFAARETKEWFNKNKLCDFNLVGFYYDKIVIALSYNYTEYLIQVKYPDEYPYFKKGHKLLQIFPSNVRMFNFIQIMNTQCVQKNISLTHMFMNISQYLNEINQTREEIRQIRQDNTIYVCRTLKPKYSDDQIFINKIISKECEKNSDDKIISKECVICFEKVHILYVVVPCGHTSACLECLTNLKMNRCPICKTDMEKYVKVYD